MRFDPGRGQDMEGDRRNIEIKCRCRDLEEVRRRALALGAEDRGLLVQEDHFFRAPQARLKLRITKGRPAELVSYRRPDVSGARGCDYRLCPVENAHALRTVLAHCLEEDGAVRKVRRLFLHGNTRIHLDTVEGLGTFVELETVLSGQTDAEGRRELESLARSLGLDASNTVPVPYLELLREKTL